MRERTLNIAQVSAMLVSTSCGVGFLLGTGELAIVQGMAGCLYAVSTAFGLVVLGACAPALWRNGLSIWGQFDELYGSTVGRNVALLSLLWMTGVLAAQIRGGSSVLALTGISHASAELMIIASLLVLSVARLSWLSAGFAFCLFACNLLLLHSLLGHGEVRAWLLAPASFVEAIEHHGSAHTIFVSLSVVGMVVCGADYQQFVIRGRQPRSARVGSLVAAVLVLAMGFLLASAVIAAGLPDHELRTADAIQVVPLLLMHGFPGGETFGARDLVIVVLVTTALGSASAILRAMADAAATLGKPSIMRPVWSRALAVLLGAVVASRPQSLVDMMVELNLIYIAAVGPLLTLTLARIRVSDRAANSAMRIACLISLSGYMIRWKINPSISEAVPLLASIAAALIVMVLYRAQIVAGSGNQLAQGTRVLRTSTFNYRRRTRPAAQTKQTTVELRPDAHDA